MATTSIRTSAKKALVDALTVAVGDDAQVTYGFPGRDIERRCVYVIGPSQGAVGYPVVMAGRKQRDDIFVLTVVVYVADPSYSQYEAEVACEQLYETVENELAGASLGIDGEISTELGPSVAGPNGNPLDEGSQAVLMADVTVHARLN